MDAHAEVHSTRCGLGPCVGEFCFAWLTPYFVSVAVFSCCRALSVAVAIAVTVAGICYCLLSLSLSLTATLPLSPTPFPIPFLLTSTRSNFINEVYQEIELKAWAETCEQRKRQHKALEAADLATLRELQHTASERRGKFDVAAYLAVSEASKCTPV